MVKPIILAVDDEPQLLKAVELDRRRHFRGDYHTMEAGAGADTLRAVRRLKKRNSPVALFLVDR